MKNMNKKGFQVTGGVVIIVGIVLVLAYTQGYLDFIFQPAEPVLPVLPTSQCPSSGLTEVTLNTQEALASTATDAMVSYYVYDNGVLVKEGTSGSDGEVSFDLGCSIGQKYTMLVVNESTSSGYYPQTVTVDATKSTDVHNLKMYEYGEIALGYVGSYADPARGDNIYAGLGKTCEFEISFSENESASAFNKPLIMCLANVSSVIDVTMDSTIVTEAAAKKPIRLSAKTGYQYYAFEYDTLLKSTDSGPKITGKIEFSASTTPKGADNFSCLIVDQATFKVAEYKTLSLSDGFLQATENTETLADVGAPDSNIKNMYFNDTAYC